MLGAPRTLATLLERLVDYAGLFPPAALDMPGAVEAYANHRVGPHAAALGRFVVPVSRLGELSGEAARLCGGEASGPCWPLSVLGTLPIEQDVATVARFNARFGKSDAGWCARVESIETPVATPADIETASRAVEGLALFVEIDIEGPSAQLLDAAARHGCRVKVRTGGTSPAAFPSSSQLAAFLAGCTRRSLPFKATAGLHHPIRSWRPVTSEPGAPHAAMHGFLNVLLASALLYSGRIDREGATALLDDTDPGGFRFTHDDARWGDYRLTDDDLAAARRVALGFGSCSFHDPIDDLFALGLLGVPAS